MPWKKIRKIVFRALLALVFIWIAGDFIYSQWVGYRIQQWEASIERDFAGVQKDFGEFDIGDGKTALLLVHGFNDSPSAYAKLAPELATHGFHCRVTRLPGFAKPVPEYGRTKHENWIQHVTREIGLLKQTHDRVFVIAHSLGGATMINVMLENQPDVDGVILLSPAVEVSSQRSPVLSTRAWHEIGRRLLLFTRVVENPFTIDARDPVEAGKKERCPFSPIAVIDEMFALIDKNRGRASEITTPTLFVLTENDRVIDFESCKKFYEELGSSDKRLVLNNRAGHALPYDYGWEQIAVETIEFIKSLDAEINQDADTNQETTNQVTTLEDAPL